jgi:hypothetical protein
MSTNIISHHNLGKLISFITRGHEANINGTECESIKITAAAFSILSTHTKETAPSPLLKATDQPPE